MAISIGGFVNRILDKFLPDIVGDVIGGAIDTYLGNAAGAALNFADALMDVVGFLGAEELAAQGMDVLEGIDVGQHLENAITGGGGGSGGGIGDAAIPDLSVVGDQTVFDVGMSEPVMGLDTPMDGYFSPTTDGAYL